MSKKKSALNENEKDNLKTVEELNEKTSNNSDSVKYSGTVVIKYTDSKTGKLKTIRKHNEGDEGLFSFICHALAENIDKRNLYKPKSIMLYDDKNKELLAQRVPYNSSPILYNNSTKSTESCNEIKYLFNITSGNFINIGSKVSKMILWNSYNGDNSNLGKCAEITYDAASAPELQAGTNLVVYWSLSFGNESKETETE